jgi:hypothetical protein
MASAQQTIHGFCRLDSATTLASVRVCAVHETDTVRGESRFNGDGRTGHLVRFLSRPAVERAIQIRTNHKFAGRRRRRLTCVSVLSPLVPHHVIGGDRWRDRQQLLYHSNCSGGLRLHLIQLGSKLQDGRYLKIQRINLLRGVPRGGPKHFGKE